MPQATLKISWRLRNPQDNPFHDQENSTDFKVETYSTLVNEHICFINTTQSIEFNFNNWNFSQSIQCSMKVFQNKNGDIYDHNIFVDTENCNDNLCWSNYDKNAFVNVTILLGAPISCDGSIFGILKNGMFYRHERWRFGF